MDEYRDKSYLFNPRCDVLTVRHDDGLVYKKIY